MTNSLLMAASLAIALGDLHMAETYMFEAARSAVGTAQLYPCIRALNAVRRLAGS